MKISFRILLINFIIVVLVFSSSTIVYYSLTTKLISLQQTKSLLNSANDFVFNFQAVVQELEEDYLRLKTQKDFNTAPNLEKTSIDFLFKVRNSDDIIPEFYYISADIPFDYNYTSLAKFTRENPNAILIKSEQSDSVEIYYGKLITNIFLDNLSKKIRAEVAVLLNNVPVAISNEQHNSNYIPSIINASKELEYKNNFDITTAELDEADFYASYYNPSDFSIANSKINFIIFTKLPEAAELRSNINYLLLIIGVAGISLSLILVMIFTAKLRKQIGHLSETTDKIRAGDIKERVKMDSNDELGTLGSAFNNMLDELERKETALHEYSEFIAMINQNPTLSEVAEAALTKIIKSIGVNAGRLSLVVDGKPNTISTYGIQKMPVGDSQNIDLYQRVIEKGEIVELFFDKNFPKLQSGLVELDVKYILIFPIIYNKKIIAVLELVSISGNNERAKEYLENIKEQLAIGLSHAVAFRQLENFVGELKRLNEDYQRQNEQISNQNRELLELHKQLKEKADELEIEKQKAIEASVLKSQFLANMSHELKTPLNSILGLSQIIIDEKSITPSDRERMNVILRNGNRLIGLINDILNFSKIEAGKVDVINEEFSLREFITEIEGHISPLIKDKNLNFVIHNEQKTDLIIKTDRNKLLQILLNLLSNAVKFTEKGIIVLKCKIVDNEKLHFEVVDSGIGISQENLKVIFEEFRQIDGSSTRKYSGTGLGLAISKRFAELINATLVCDSEVGRGSIFTLTLPVNIVAEKQEDLPDLFSETSKGKIILADDSAENRKFIMEYLISKKYEVLFADDFDSIDRLCSEIRPQAVLLNLTSPLFAGWKALQKLVTQNEINLPVITYIINEANNVGYGLPVFEYLSWPINEKNLSACVGKYNRLSGENIDNVLIIEDDGYELRTLKEAYKEKSPNLIFVSKDYDTAKTIAKIQPDIVFITLSNSVINEIELLQTIKENVLLRKIPVVLSIPREFSPVEYKKLNDNLIKTAFYSKNFPIDVLKVIRDRLHLEDGLPHEDTSAIWIESKAETLSDVNNNKPGVFGKRQQVLIVDDDADTLFTVGEMIKRIGSDVSYAKNGLECLSSLKTLKPDLILLDIMMPLMDGFETIKRIRNDKTWKFIPVFAMTAKAMLEDRDVVIKNGFDDLIPKPVNVNELTTKVEKIFSRQTFIEVK